MIADLVGLGTVEAMQRRDYHRRQRIFAFFVLASLAVSVLAAAIPF